MSLTDGIIGAMIVGGGKGGGSSVVPNINAAAETLPAGSEATVDKSGSNTNVLFTFGIPQGIQGTQGPTGPAGQGVPSGGTAGQVLVKATDENYSTAWENPSSLGIIPVLDIGTVTGTPPVQIPLTPEQVAQSQLDNAMTQAVYQGITLHLQKIGQSDTQVVFSGFASGSNIFLLVNIESGNATFNVATVKGIPAGGNTGQVLAKSSDNDYEAQWVDQTEATVSVNVGTTTTGEAGTEASVTNSGTEQNVVLNFTIPRGSQGAQGVSVQSIERTSGTGAAGTYDTYTITLSNGASSQFQVYNGANGDGSGDFMANGSVPMTAPLQMGGNQIKNVATPTEETDGATKGYVDTNTYSQQQANDRFALALTTTDGPSSSLTIYPDQGSNMTITAQGFTTQEGSGNPSPDNVRPIKAGGIGMVKLIADSSNLSIWSTSVLPSGANRWTIDTAYLPGIKNPIYNYVVAEIWCDQYESITADDVWAANKGISITFTPIISLYDPNFKSASLQDWKNHISENPLTIWYATEDGSGDLYTPIIAEGADYHCECLLLNEPLCEGDTVATTGVENHTSKFLNVSQFEQGDGGYVISATDATDGPVDCNVFSGLSVINGQILVPASQFPSTVTSLETANQWLATQPVQVVYFLSTPVTYTKTVTLFIANPSTDGSVTISGENTVSATYNKSIAKAIEELKALISDQTTP